MIEDKPIRSKEAEYHFPIKEGQNLIDVAIQEGGNVETISEILQMNESVNLNDPLPHGSLNHSPQTNAVAAYFAQKGILINTGGTPVPLPPQAQHYELTHYNSQHYK
jgi:alanine dehydrogenase